MMKAIAKIHRRSSPTITPQALAWDGDHLWISSRDLGTLYKIDIETWRIVDEIDPPGIVWSAVSSGNGKMCFTIGKGLNDDRYIYRYARKKGSPNYLHVLISRARTSASTANIST